MKKLVLLLMLLSVVPAITLATNIQSHPASQVSAGTFGAGNFVFPNNLTVNEYYFGNGRFLTNINESLWLGNSSLVAFLANQSQWNVNSSTWCNDSQYLNGSGSSNFYPSSNPNDFISTWIPNTTLEMKNAVNNSGYYNITSQQCFYVGNVTERNAFLNIYNSSYLTQELELMFNNNWTNISSWLYNQTENAMDYCDDTFITKANEGNLNTNSSTYWSGLDAFPTLYEANISDLQSYLLTESDPLWSGNYTDFNDSWSSTFNATYDALVTDNESWNETLADTLYYSIDNPFGFYNSTSLPYFINSTFNSTYGAKADYNFSDNNFNGSGNFTTTGTGLFGDILATDNITADYFLGDGSLLTGISTYNSTYDDLVSDNTSWNESYANELYYSISNPFAFINDTTWQYNQTSPAVSWVQGQNYLTQEDEPMWNGNFSSVAFLSNQNQWNVNSSTYCSNVLSGSYCYNESYNPFEVPKTCSDIWGFSCSGTENDAYLGCNGTKYDPIDSGTDVHEIYINASSFLYESYINVACEFHELSGYVSYEYMWYNNDSTSNANWIKIWNDSYDVDGPNNRSAVFKLNSTEGTQIVRCVLSWNVETTGNCSDVTGAVSHDNDDVNFTVTENDTGNITHEVCIDSTQNITVNNSIYFNGFASSYFYPYSNPSGYISGFTETDPDWNSNFSNTGGYLNVSHGGNFYNTPYLIGFGTLVSQVAWNVYDYDTFTELDYKYFYPYSNPYGFLNYTFNSSYEYWTNASLVSTFNTTYDSFVQANLSNNSLYINGKLEANLNVNNSAYCNGGTCLVANAGNVSNNTLFCNGGVCVVASLSNVSNNSLYFGGLLPASYALVSLSNVSNNTLFFNGQNGNYFWNTTGGIPYSNLTLAKSIVTGDLATAFSINLGNISGGSVANNWNMSFYNQSYYLSSASTPTCSKYYNVSTLLWCDCFNTTHKWVSNTC